LEFFIICGIAFGMLSAMRTVSLVQEPLKQGKSARYRVHLASSEAELMRAQRLRFLVFNLELNEGLEAAFVDGYDRDPFDAVCDHLLVEDTTTGEVVGTYRLQMGTIAAQALGYYSEQEFNFAPFEKIRPQVLELGRACVHRDHRSFEVLNLLWKGIAQYASSTGTRYLLGCSSLTSQDPVDGWSVFNRLRNYLCDETLQTAPKPGFRLTSMEVDSEKDPPKLLRAYLAIGAKICGPPAIDREFRTIDFLTLLDLQTLPPSIRARYLGTT
jgi:putative hemolysin